MQKIRLAFGADHFQKLHQNLVSLINESVARKGYEVFWFDFNKVKKRSGIVYLPLREIRRKIRILTKGRMLTHGPVIETDAALMDAIVLKKDPPQSHRTLKILKKVCKSILVVNDPHGILKYESKTWLKKLKNLTVPTYYSENIKELEKAVKRIGNCVLKEDVGFGGQGVYHLTAEKGNYYVQTNKITTPRKVNLRPLLKKLTRNGKREVLVVKYLKRVTHGDKRIFVFDNHILGAFLRMPKNSKGWVCNVSSGGYVKRTRVTKQEKVIVKSVEKLLKKDKVYAIGIDTLEDDNGKRILSEVNTSNVGGIYNIERLYNRNVSKFIIDWIEKKVRKGEL